MLAKILKRLKLHSEFKNRGEAEKQGGVGVASLKENRTSMKENRTISVIRISGTHVFI